MLSYRRTSASALVILVFSACLLAREAAPKVVALKGPSAVEDGITIYFSPNGGCEAAIVARIILAKKTIDVQAYSFTNTGIAKAISEAKDRGIKIRAVLDKSNQSDKYSSATYLANHDIPVSIDAKHAIAHNKIIIIDGATVITGSFNFSKAAEEKNAENLLIIDGKKLLVAAYVKNFDEHLQHSEKYMAKSKG